MLSLLSVLSLVDTVFSVLAVVGVVYFVAFVSVVAVAVVITFVTVVALWLLLLFLLLSLVSLFSVLSVVTVGAGVAVVAVFTVFVFDTGVTIGTNVTVVVQGTMGRNLFIYRLLLYLVGYPAGFLRRREACLLTGAFNCSFVTTLKGLLLYVMFQGCLLTMRSQERTGLAKHAWIMTLNST